MAPSFLPSSSPKAARLPSSEVQEAASELGLILGVKNTFLDFRDSDSPHGMARLRSHSEPRSPLLASPSPKFPEEFKPCSMQEAPPDAGQGACKNGRGEIPGQPQGIAKSRRDRLRNRGAKAQCQSPTTMMLRGVPCRFTSDDVLAFIDELGLEGTYDFFYLPQDAQCRSNLGYAFVNFKDTAYATTCLEKLHNKPLGSTRSSKVLTIT